MKALMLVTFLFISMLSYSQNDSSKTLVTKGDPIKQKATIEPEKVKETFDGTFYIITDKEAPESFMNNIFSIAEELREENKDVKVKISDRSTIVVFSKKKINKDNFEPVKTMIQLK